MAVLVLGLGCSRRNPPTADSPHETLLSIVAEFQLAANRDPYRQPQGLDALGQPIARSTLVRLSNYELLHPGRFTPELLMVRGRTLEWLGDLTNAETAYLEAAEFETELRAEATRRAEALRRILAAASVERLPEDPESLVDELDAMARRQIELSEQLDAPFYRALARREAESTEIRRAEFMTSVRRLLPDGDAQAQAAHEAIVARHRESSRSIEHALRLARFHRTMAEDEARQNPPAGLAFDRTRFQRHYRAALDLMYRVSQADGRPERLLALHELDALLEYGRQVDRESQP